MRRLSLLVLATAMLMLSPKLTFAQNDSASALVLAARLASTPGGPPAQVTIAALPPGWTAPVPLPVNIPILGSVMRFSGREIDIYYRPADARQAFSSYVAALRSSGFTDAEVRPLAAGFAILPSFLQNYATVCGKGQRVSVSSTPSSNDDLRVTIMPGETCGSPATPLLQKLMTTPLPSFVAPAGTVVTPTSTTGLPLEWITGEPNLAFSSAAAIRGNVMLPQIFHSLASQLTAAGWQVSDALSDPDTMMSTLQFDRLGEQWRGWLAVYRGDQPHVFAARVDLSGATTLARRNALEHQMAFTPMTELSWIPVTVRRSDEPVLLQLVHRILTQNEYIPVQLYLRRAPPGFGDYPLPNGAPLASTISRSDPSPYATTSYTLYYTLSNKTLKSYFARLRAKGWNGRLASLADLGGFQSANVPQVAIFCKNTKLAPISVELATHSNAATISVELFQIGSACGAPNNVEASMQTPLPRLMPPAGVDMHIGMAGVAGGASGASFITALPLSVLLRSFTAQFVQKGWTPRDSIVTNALGSRTYTYNDSKGQRWQAVLTIYRSTIRNNQYYGFIDLTNVTPIGART